MEQEEQDPGLGRKRTKPESGQSLESRIASAGRMAATTLQDRCRCQPARWRWTSARGRRRCADGFVDHHRGRAVRTGWRFREPARRGRRPWLSAAAAVAGDRRAPGRRAAAHPRRPGLVGMLRDRHHHLLAERREQGFGPGGRHRQALMQSQRLGEVGVAGAGRQPQAFRSAESTACWPATVRGPEDRRRDAGAAPSGVQELVLDPLLPLVDRAEKNADRDRQQKILTQVGPRCDHQPPVVRPAGDRRDVSVAEAAGRTPRRPSSPRSASW